MIDTSKHYCDSDTDHGRAVREEQKVKVEYVMLNCCSFKTQINAFTRAILVIEKSVQFSFCQAKQV